jgi:beta-mannosidase
MGRGVDDGWSKRWQLNDGWQLCGTAPGHWPSPASIDTSGPTAGVGAWRVLPGIGPVAAMLRARGEWSLDEPPQRFDAHDWWFRCRFDLPDGARPGDLVLGLDGLATVAEVWLNGERLLESDNMFVAHELQPGGRWRPTGNELCLVFRSLDEALKQRRPRPRWKAPMIEHQQLRWFRTTVLGRTPGWSPAAAVVGPWRPVWLGERAGASLAQAQWRADLEGEHGGRVVVDAVVRAAAGQRIAGVALCVQRDDGCHEAALHDLGDGRWQGQAEIEQVARWWPHTHGEPASYVVELHVAFEGGAGRQVIQLGRTGFRSVELDQQGDGFALKVNGERVFCRGACWTPLDPVTLDAATPESYEVAVRQMREAGMNMVRVGGTMAYEADAFYDECDRQGVLVWQEFMFANMDYPETPEFVASVEREVRQQLQRWQGRPALAILCGNSEVEQQAAMFGATRERWQPALFHEAIAGWCGQDAPGVPYWPSSAHGGAFPHQGNVGTTSYYGVGAYQRELGDARRADVRFATECLAFANVPEPALFTQIPGGHSVRVHHPAWKARTPRDLGAGWDFEDVRDHYLSTCFGVDPARLRYSDHDRYLALSRVVSAEVMAATMSEWRREESRCGGALVWFMRDLLPGAGWGVVDASGRAKAAYHGLKRALQPVSVSLSDEGGNGYAVHVANETGDSIQAHLDVLAWRDGMTEVARATKALVLAPRQVAGAPLLAWFDWFADWSWSYRFGPASAHQVAVRLRADDGRLLGEAVAFPTGWHLPVQADLGLQAVARPADEGGWLLSLEARHFAQSVSIAFEGHEPEDAYFHLLPGLPRTVRLRPCGVPPARLAGDVWALNGSGPVAIVVEGAGG